MHDDTRSKLHRGLRIGLGMALLVPLVALACGYVLAQAGYRLSVNLTPSIPQGFYLASDTVPPVLLRGQVVAFYPYSPATEHAFQQGWLKPGAAYHKRVAAVAGDTVCVGKDLTIRTVSRAGEPAAFIRVGEVATTDRQGRPLPRLLRGCQQVPVGHFLPIGDGLPNSYDGRYYGFVPIFRVHAILHPLFTWEGAAK